MDNKKYTPMGYIFYISMNSFQRNVSTRSAPFRLRFFMVFLLLTNDTL